jgi:hypothetical protein
MVGVSCLVEDPTGRAEFFSIYNLPLPDIGTGPDLDALLPLGQILAIREPTFKPNSDGRGQLLRADSPSDVVFLQPNDPLLRGINWTYNSPATPSPLSFDHKAHGNSLFKQKKYLLAAKAYSDGLIAPSSDEQKLLLHLNRSQTHLFLNNYASAYRDSTTVLSLLDLGVEGPAQTKFKAVLRQARALEGLRKLDMADAAYGLVIKLDSSSSDGRAGKKRVAKMLEQGRTGKFDGFASDATRLSEEDDSSTGDFFGPIKVVEIESRGGGRGVVATRDIAAGETVLGSSFHPFFHFASFLFTAAPHHFVKPSSMS